MYVKLFFILGILWICECLKLLLPVNSHIAQEDQGGSEEYIFQAIVVLLFLRGFFFFVIFIMKKSVLINLQAYFHCNPTTSLEDPLILCHVKEKVTIWVCSIIYYVTHYCLFFMSCVHKRGLKLFNLISEQRLLLIWF